jgi:cell division transport system ATP-binding protein
MILFENVTKKYGNEYVALEGISFTVPKGDFTYLIGPTGSGKTTIFRLIIKDILPSEGSIMLGEWDILKLPKKKLPTLRRKVGVIFQDLKLLMDRTVAENVMLPLLFSGVSEDEAKKRAEEALIEVDLSGSFDKFPLQLSGGERQRVAIARALVFEPEIILADEPTGNLDIKTSQQIINLLKSINKKGTTIFMATHNEGVIGDEDRVLVLEKGKLREEKKRK